MLEMSEFATRRQKLMHMIGDTGLFILPAAAVAYRNSDCEYPYRQNSDFYYLSGYEEPDSVIILAPKDPKGPFILFNRKKDRQEEIWQGHRSGQVGAIKTFHADQAYPIEELEKRLPAFLDGRKTLHYPIGIHSSFDKIILNAINKIRGRVRNGLVPPIALVDITDTLHEMRLIKSSAEIKIMQKAATISANGHVRAMQICKPGMNEYELAADLQYEFQRHGAQSVAYTSIVGSGANSCILHYVENNKVIANSSMVLIDAGCEYLNYASDITRTFPANGKFTEEQRAIYNIVLESQIAGIKLIRPGVKWSAVQDVIVKIITKGLVDLKILKGKVDELIEKKAYAPFYMHNSGHWLGLDVHDVGRYKINGKWRPFKSGMVLTVEPGIYISSDIPGVHKRWHNIGIRIEDDILVTSKGHKILTEALPKEINDIEGLMQ